MADHDLPLPAMEASDAPAAPARRLVDISYPDLRVDRERGMLTAREHTAANRTIATGLAVFGTALLLTGWAARLADVLHLGVGLIALAAAVRFWGFINDVVRCRLDIKTGQAVLRPRGLGRLVRLPLEQIAAVQVLPAGLGPSRHRSRGWYWGVRIAPPHVPMLQLNFILADGTRLNLMHSEFGVSVRQTANEIADFLQVPLHDPIEETDDEQ
ncbi:MAG: hypothetical protein BIFFINMI_00526 [Phycisphaerae bacterium]|nr:hypothetical protein [Phycisphaerae bacterium]